MYNKNTPGNIINKFDITVCNVTEVFFLIMIPLKLE